uniref:Uncharacterized protein n=1 Tax=Colobus angolensis palliatus TaxID=336983 RepID=A0A2K5HXY2_COLAP
MCLVKGDCKFSDEVTLHGMASGRQAGMMEKAQGLWKLKFQRGGF